MATATTDWHPGRRTSAALQVHLLGPTELDAAVALQERIADQLTSRSDRHGVLLLCEHPQGITFGRDSSVTDLLVERDELETRDVPLRWARRGGGTWAHHPGQLVAYLIVPVTRLGFTIPGFVERLTATFHQVGQEQRVWPDPLPEAPGLHGRCGTMGFVGAAVSDGISRFGGCLNVSVPQPALRIVSWGPGIRPTSLAAERMRPITMAAVRECWVRHIAAELGYEHYHLGTGHPALKRTSRRMYVCSEP